MVKVVEKLDFLDVLDFLEELEFLVILDADALISRNSPIFSQSGERSQHYRIVISTGTGICPSIV